MNVLARCDSVPHALRHFASLVRSRRLVRQFVQRAMVALGAAACGSSGGSSSCPALAGTYEVSARPTGQSENLSGSCSATLPALVVDVAIANGVVSLDGETCAICSASGCQVDIVCGKSVACPDVTPETDAGASYVQTLEFWLPGAPDASTGNAVIDVGPSYCGYAGVAARKGL
jgi:hypothetical protein